MFLLIAALVTLGSASTPDEIGLALKKAVYENNVARVDELLAQGADPNFKTAPDDSHTAIFWAIQHGNAPILKKLIDHGARLNEGAVAVTTIPIIAKRWEQKVQVGDVIVGKDSSGAIEIALGKDVFRTAEKDLEALVAAIASGKEFDVLAADYERAQGCKFTYADMLMSTIRAHLQNRGNWPQTDPGKAMQAEHEAQLKKYQAVWKLLYAHHASCGTCDFKDTQRCKNAVLMERGLPLNQPLAPLTLQAQTDRKVKAVYEGGRIKEAPGRPVPAEILPGH
jgi:hypothetical protein